MHRCRPPATAVATYLQLAVTVWALVALVAPVHSHNLAANSLQINRQHTNSLHTDSVADTATATDATAIGEPYTHTGVVTRDIDNVMNQGRVM